MLFICSHSIHPSTTNMLCQSLFSATKQTKMFSLHFLPLVIVHSAGAGRQPLSDTVVPPVPAHGGLPQTQNGLFVAQDTSVVGSTGVCRVSQPLDIVRVGTCTQTHTHTHTTITSIHSERSPSLPLQNRPTFPGEELPEVDGDHHPFTQVVPVAPQADVHGARARLAVHAAEVKGVVGEVVRVPALALVC